MAKVKSFNVSREKGGPSYLLKLTVGSMPSDPAWQDLNLTEQQINDKAISTVIINLQSYLRAKWPANQAEAQRVTDEWAAGLKVASVACSPEKAKELKLSKEQIAGLRAIGVQF